MPDNSIPSKFGFWFIESLLQTNRKEASEGTTHSVKTHPTCRVEETEAFRSEACQKLILIKSTIDFVLQQK